MVEDQLARSALFNVSLVGRAVETERRLAALEAHLANQEEFYEKELRTEMAANARLQKQLTDLFVGRTSVTPPPEKSKAEA